MPDPDLVIRTSGEYRISNFLLWELAYSELVFTDVLWPDFRREHLFEAVREYQRRDRRFGAVEADRNEHPSRAWVGAVSLYRERGIVLRTYKLGEADRIVVLMTESRGKVRAVAKGVRKTKSRFGGRLEPMSHVALLLYEGRELDIVSQAESIDHFRTIREDLDRLSQAVTMLEVVDQVAQERESAPRLVPDAARCVAHARREAVGRRGAGVLLEGARPRGLAPRARSLRRRAGATSISSPSTSIRAACSAAPVVEGCRSARTRLPSSVASSAEGSRLRSTSRHRRRRTKSRCSRRDRSNTTSNAASAR